ncbi:MAG: polyketide synthase dehydratase domain-containing protein, partial [Oligoflexales bacterium]|nr:polyketide synthase dehydratase domain-containing protein [Oligoflexales bacterium]
MVKSSRFKFSTILKNDDYIVRDHRVHGTRIMPGVTFLDFVFKAMSAKQMETGKVELKNIVFKEPIFTTDDFDKRIEIAIERDGYTGKARGSSYKVKNGAILDYEEKINFECEIRFDAEPLRKTLDMERFLKSAKNRMEMDEAYSYARSIDINHYVFMKGLGEIYAGDEYVLAKLHLSDLSREYLGSFYMHPAFLDASTIVPGILMPKSDMTGDIKPAIPIYIESFRSSRGLGDRCYVYIEKGSIASS